MNCVLTPEIECLGPEGQRWWVCPVHKARLTPAWTRLCRTRKEYRQAWLNSCGPGQKKCPEETMVSSPGPGTELKKIIAAWQRRFPWFDLGPRKGCGCADTVRLMNRWGPAGCEQRMDTILNKMEAEAEKRKLTVPFRRTMAKLLVKQAIRRSRHGH